MHSSGKISGCGPGNLVTQFGSGRVGFGLGIHCRFGLGRPVFAVQVSGRVWVCWIFCRVGCTPFISDPMYTSSAYCHIPAPGNKCIIKI